MENPNPLVTVVIPTRNRPELVGRAVRSVLQQTLTDLEIVVVIDGPDSDTVSSLQLLQEGDPRLRILPLVQNVGGSDARNAGIDAAKGEWIALLDDDDEWLPMKLEKQLALGMNSAHPFPVVSSRIIGRTPAADFVWPRINPFLPIADCIMRRRTLFQGEGSLQTSTLVARASLFRNCRFTSGLRSNQDTDWLIRAFSYPGVGLEFVSEPLTIWYVEESRCSIGRVRDWRYSLKWVSGLRSHLSAETYAAFLLTDISSSASNAGDWSAFVPLLANAFKDGRPRPIHLALYLGMWMIPQKVRRGVRRIVQGKASPA